MKDIQPGIYRHYKGNHYQVLGVARHSETDEEMVIYQCLYGDYSFWVRPLSMFTEEIHVAGVPQSRFVLLRPDNAWMAVSAGAVDDA